MRERSDSARHYFPARPQSIITFGPSGGTETRRFRVPIPDSRLRVKIAVLFIPDAGGATDAGSAGATTLWLYEADKDRSGVSGNNIPSTNIFGTSAAPGAIPAAAGLGGYSREFVTAADYIEGVLASSSGGPMVGTWVLQVDYRPDAVRFTDDEWAEIINRASPRVLGGAAVTA